MKGTVCSLRSVTMRGLDGEGTDRDQQHEQQQAAGRSQPRLAHADQAQRKQHAGHEGGQLLLVDLPVLDHEQLRSSSMRRVRVDGLDHVLAPARMLVTKMSSRFIGSTVSTVRARAAAVAGSEAIVECAHLQFDQRAVVARRGDARQCARSRPATAPWQRMRRQLSRKDSLSFDATMPALVDEGDRIGQLLDVGGVVRREQHRALLVAQARRPARRALRCARPGPGPVVGSSSSSSFGWRAKISSSKRLDPLAVGKAAQFLLRAQVEALQQFAARRLRPSRDRWSRMKSMCQRRVLPLYRRMSSDA